MSTSREYAELISLLREKRAEVAALEAQAAQIGAEIPRLGALDGRYDEDENGCWVWRGVLNRGGYGRLTVAGKQWLAHRYAWTLAVGDIPNGLTIDHLCFNAACVNPDHLRELSQSDNSRLQRRATRDFCLRGHEMSGENVMRRNDSSHRRCRTCEDQRREARSNFDREEARRARQEFGEQVVAHIGEGWVSRTQGEQRVYYYVCLRQEKFVLRTKGEVLAIGSDVRVGHMSEGVAVVADRIRAYCAENIEAVA